MAELGWVVQFFCDHRMLAETAAALRDIAREMTVIVDHLGMVPAAQGVSDPNFQALLKLVGDGHAYVKLSAVYRLSTQFPDYSDAQPLHDALIAANPERLMWGTDWPHPSIPATVMPDDGHLLDAPGHRTNKHAGVFWSIRPRGCSDVERSSLRTFSANFLFRHCRI